MSELTPELTKCFRTDCKKLRAHYPSHGLCPDCYKSAKRLVEQGSVTWGKLEELGLASKQSGKDNSFETAFKKALENETT